MATGCNYEEDDGGTGALLAGNSNSVKVANQDCGPVANVEYEEDDGEDHFAHRFHL